MRMPKESEQSEAKSKDTAERVFRVFVIQGFVDSFRHYRFIRLS